MADHPEVGQTSQYKRVFRDLKGGFPGTRLETNVFWLPIRAPDPSRCTAGVTLSQC